MIVKTFYGNQAEPPEYAYTKPVLCHVCHEEFDREGHEYELFDLDGVPGETWATICENCTIRCGWCGESVLESWPCRIKVANALWFDGEPYDEYCFAAALCPEAE